MVLIDSILMNNCRLCHTNPGLHKISGDKKFIKEIFECIKVKVNDRAMKLLPHSVCEECKKTIKCFTVYKQQVRETDQCLRKILKNVTSTAKLLSCKSCQETCDDVVLEKRKKSHVLTNPAKEDSRESHTFMSSDNLESDDCSSAADQLCNRSDEKQGSKSEKPSYICTRPSCNKILTSAYTLKTHELKHEGKRSFLCVTCGKGFITKNSLTCHEKIHLAVKAYTCKVCDIGFSVRSNLRAHEKKHHEGVRFYCSKCTKAFSSKASLERHERIHTGIKDFKCDSCSSAFYTNKELLKHKRYHLGLRLHKCDECFKTFFERHHLIIHLRSHTGERPYVCKVPNCGKSFMESQKLKRHHNAKHAQADST